MKALIVVTHLLGTGHLARALTLARAFLAAGDSATVISGGMEAPHLETDDVHVVHLPPVRSNGVDFTTLLDAHGQPADADHMAARQAALLQSLDNIDPDVIITELFPFGRRILREEFLTLLDAAKARGIPCLCSIRDILAPPSKPAKADWTANVIAEQYVGVLIHSVETIAPLGLSWPVTDSLRKRMLYTGFVAPKAPDAHPQATGAGEVLVSAGGGDVGAHLFEAAAKAAAHDQARQWRLLVGGKDADATVTRLRVHAPANLTCEPARPDFRQMLRHAAASVSMCGYNTALDVLQTGVPAVFVPFDAEQEVEQSIRAKALATQKAVDVIASQDLCADALLRAVQNVIAAGPRAPVTDGMNGAAETVRITRRIVEDFDAS